MKHWFSRPRMGAALLVLLAVGAACALADWIKTDRCLDAGGRVDPDSQQCDGATR